MKPIGAGRQSLPRAFRNAAAGVIDFVGERNSRVQLAAGGVAVAFGVAARLTRTEWAVLTVTIAGVLATEAMNCAVERVVDLASPGRHELARQAKDLAAGAVLIASIGAAAVGLLLFGPHLAAWWARTGGP